MTSIIPCYGKVIIFKAFEASQLSRAWLDMAILSAVTKNVCFLLRSTPRKTTNLCLEIVNLMKQ